MATVEDCRAALRRLAARLAEMDPDTRGRHTLDRTVSCGVPDLGVVFSARLRDGKLEDITEHVPENAGSAAPSAVPSAVPSAQVRLTIGSDDLLALVDGRLGFANAWATGRMRVQASLPDLLRLRKLL